MGRRVYESCGLTETAPAGSPALHMSQLSVISACTSMNTSQDAHLPNFCCRIAGTPADRILRMIQDIQCGSTPSSEDLSFVRSIVHRRLDIYNPLDVARQLLQAGSIDVSY